MTMITEIEEGAPPVASQEPGGDLPPWSQIASAARPRDPTGLIERVAHNLAKSEGIPVDNHHRHCAKTVIDAHWANVGLQPLQPDRKL
jgi:hypothetical protein